MGTSTIPDFALGSGVGVEVRRLNEHYFRGGRAEGLEQVDRRVWGALGEAVSHFESESADRSFWVFVEYGRPLATRPRKLRRLFEQALAAFLKEMPKGGPQPHKIPISDSLRLLLYPSSLSDRSMFRLGGSSDEDSGGLVSGIYVNNINHCIDEKSRKLSGVASAFSEWWLLLVDNMGLGLASPETEAVSTSVESLGSFSRVIVLDYKGSRVLLDLPDGA